MPLRNGGFVFYVDVWAFFNRSAVGLFALRNISQLVRRRTMCVSTSVVILKQHRTIPALRLKHRFGGCGTASAAPRSPHRHLELCGIALIKIVPPSYLPTFSLRPDFALFFCPFAQEKDSHSMEKALLSFRQQGNFYNVLFSDLYRITGGSNAVRCSS